MNCCCCRTESSKKKPPIYKVMLHNDNYNRREYVVKILLKTVEGLTVDDAVNVMQVRWLPQPAAANSSSSRERSTNRQQHLQAVSLLRGRQHHAAAVG